MMTEQKLKEYFECILTAEQLSLDLKDSQKQTSHDVTAVYIDNLNSGEFEVKKEHMLKLCDDAILGKLLPTDLNTIGFALMASDYFFWESDTDNGKLIGDVVLEWDTPEIGYDLTLKNLKLWKEYLLTGEYRLDKNELKQKFRCKGKNLGLYRAIDEILWNDWDPIGVNNSAPRDEYQGYTPEILRLKISGADKESIANRLNEIVTRNMGLIGDIDHCKLIAEMIINL